MFAAGGFDARYGQGSQEAWRGQDGPSSHRPGRARPISPQSAGTPYGYPGEPLGGVGNYGNMGGRARPAPFSTSVTDWTGRQMSPSQYFRQRDAFIQQINDAQLQQSALSGLNNAPPQAMDFGAMHGRAGDMQQAGWQNPFAYSQPTNGGQMGGGSPDGPNYYGEILRAHDDPSNPRNSGGSNQGGRFSVGGWPDNFGGAEGMPDIYGVRGSNRPIPTPPPPPPPAQPAPRRAASPFQGQNADRTDYGAETQAWIDRTRRENNDPNGQMQQMLRGMTPANRSIYSLMMNDFSQQQRSAGIAAAKAPMFNAYAAQRR